MQVSNQNIIAAEAAYREARAIVAEDRGALFPTLDLTGSGTRSGSGGKGSGALVTGAGGSGSVISTVNGTDQYRVSLGASWEPDVWGRIRRTIEGSRSQAEASAADLEAAKLTAQAELATGYFGLREADAEIAIDRATVTAYQRSLTIAQNRYNAGVTVRSDVYQAQTQLANAQADLAGLDQQRANFEHAIAVLTGEAPGNFSVATAPWIGNVPPVPPTVPSAILQRRPDVAGAERRVQAANAQIGVQIAAFFPDVTLSGSYGYAATELGHLFSSSASLWSYGASVAETVFNGGARVAQVHAARAAHDQSVAQYRETVLQASAERRGPADRHQGPLATGRPAPPGLGRRRCRREDLPQPVHLRHRRLYRCGHRPDRRLQRAPRGGPERGPAADDGGGADPVAGRRLACAERP